MMKRRHLAWLAGIWLTAVALAGCGNDTSENMVGVKGEPARTDEQSEGGDVVDTIEGGVDQVFGEAGDGDITCDTYSHAEVGDVVGLTYSPDDIDFAGVSNWGARGCDWSFGDLGVGLYTAMADVTAERLADAYCGRVYDRCQVGDGQVTLVSTEKLSENWTIYITMCWNGPSPAGSPVAWVSSEDGPEVSEQLCPRVVDLAR